MKTKTRNKKTKQELGKGEEANKSTTKDPTLEHTSMRAWMVSGWNSLVAQNGFLVLDINMEDMSIQLQTLVEKPPF